MSHPVRLPDLHRCSRSAVVGSPSKINIAAFVITRKCTEKFIFSPESRVWVTSRPRFFFGPFPLLSVAFSRFHARRTSVRVRPVEPVPPFRLGRGGSDPARYPPVDRGRIGV